MGEVALCWAQSRLDMEHESDEYKNQYIIVVLPLPTSWVYKANTRSPVLVSVASKRA